VGYRGNTFNICRQEVFVEHSLHIIVMNVITLPDCSMVTVAVTAWTVIITSVMVTFSMSSVDVCPWQRDVRNN